MRMIPCVGNLTKKRGDVHHIRYFDDFVALSSRPFRKTRLFIEAMSYNLTLELNTEKTKITTAKDRFHFFSFRFIEKYVYFYGK